MISPTRRYTPEYLLEQLRLLPDTARYWVGFSGGADSSALLDSLLEIQPDLSAEIHAIHINHGLQADAAGWQAHCRDYCRKKGVPLKVRTLKLGPHEAKSPEALARAARYSAVEELLADGDIYLTAHHADDQAETLFLHLMRGSGLDGLSGIPVIRKLGKGWAARPLLRIRRVELEQYLCSRRVSWIIDPSNQESKADRNFLRNDIFPLLESRWPGLADRLSQSAQHADDARSLLSSLITQHHGKLLADPIIMPVNPLLELDKPARALIIRQWLRQHGTIMPPRQRLEEFLAQLTPSASAGNQAEMRWSGWMIKRHDSLLWAHQTSFPKLCPTRSWTGGSSLNLGASHGNLQLCGSPAALPPGMEVGSRRPGAAMALHRDGPRKKAKDLLRASGVPTWLRPAVPMVYLDGELQAVGDWLPGADFASWLVKNQLSYQWRPVHPLLCKLQSVSVQCLAVSEFKNERIQGKDP